jgi:hypothetical protein
MTIHVHLVPRSIMVELWVHYPMLLHGIVLNYMFKHRDNLAVSAQSDSSVEAT